MTVRKSSDDLEGKESSGEQMIIGKIRKSMNDDL